MNTLIHGDCIEILKQRRVRRLHPFDLGVADPPFNIGLGYDTHNDRMKAADYLRWSGEWIDALTDCAAPKASLYVLIGDEFAAELKGLIELSGWFFRSWIIWAYTFGVYCDSKWGRGHTHVLYFTRHPREFTFNSDPVRVPSARQTKYKDARANPKGRVPSDVWEFSRVCGTFKERRKDGAPCQTPEALVERIVRASSNQGDLVLDPMMGNGTVPAVAKRLRRNYVGIELSAKYHAEAGKRLAEVKAVG